MERLQRWFVRWGWRTAKGGSDSDKRDAPANLLLDHILPEMLRRVEAWDVTESGLSDERDFMFIHEQNWSIHGPYVFINLRGVVVTWYRDHPLKSEMRINRSRDYENLAHSPFARWRIWRFGIKVGAVLARRRMMKEAEDVLEALSV